VRSPRSQPLSLLLGVGVTDARPRVAGTPEAWQGAAPTPPDSGALTTISGLDTAGLSARDEWSFYVRPAMREQWDFLVSSFDNRHKKHEGTVMYYNHLLVGGPPGTGKSSTTWLWCQWMARVRGVTVLWLHKAHAAGAF
jgi:hypothetical protein